MRSEIPSQEHALPMSRETLTQLFEALERKIQRLSRNKNHPLLVESLARLATELREKMKELKALPPSVKGEVLNEYLQFREAYALTVANIEEGQGKKRLPMF